MAAPPSLNLLTTRDAVAAYIRILDTRVLNSALKPTTARNYSRDVTEFADLAVARFAEDVLLDEIEPGDLDEIVTAYAAAPDGRYTARPGRSRGAGAVIRFTKSVSKFFSVAHAEGWIRENPVPRMHAKPKVETVDPKRKALPKTRAAALIDAATTAPEKKVPHRGHDALGTRDTFILLLLLESGPRVGEVCAADLADMETDDDGCWLLIRHGKGGKQRRIPVSAATWNAFVDYVATGRPKPRPRTRKTIDPGTGEQRVVEVDPVTDAEKALLLTWRGLRMTPRDLQKLLTRLVARVPEAERRDVTPHGLRHTAATLLLANGADIHTVKALLGHESIATTGLYLDTEDRAMRDAVDQHPLTAQA